MLKRTLCCAIFIWAFTACSGGGGGGSSSGGSTSASAGYLGAPSATCAGSSCVPGASVSSSEVHIASTVVSRTVDTYEAFNGTFIKQLNQFLKKVYDGMVAGGSTDCSDVAIGSSGTVNGYAFSISAGASTIPSAFTKSGVTYDYRINASASGSAVADIQVYCGQGTASDPLTVTARVKESGSKYEFIYEKSGNKIRVMGAGILASGLRIVAWFNTLDGDDFDLVIKSNVNSVTDYYAARGKKSIDTYYVENVTQTISACVNSSGGAANCAGFGVSALPTLAVASLTNFNTVNVGTFTIADP